ncbi:MAG: protoheme IX farnesyltransferase [Alphaproteobacteria bacterium]|nr:protoheme IX farnesyltransferase [Alphaproteobacteria bacterium]MBV8548512.1 protoheme IX farnesyltransferase [Alphaproteobacteria bacterium]
MSSTSGLIPDAAPGHDAYRHGAPALATLRDYIQLLKPRVMSLVVFSGLVGIVTAPVDMHPLLSFVTLLCIALSAGGAAAINMWYDRDIDAVMTRTQRRPIPRGVMDPDVALEFGGCMIFAATVIMALAIGWLAAGLLAFAALFYVLVYTMGLKRRTPQNIVIGGAAGAFPPMIAEAAATGHVGWHALVLFMIIFFWTPPHFWALALYRSDDYARAGVPMMPVVKGARRTKWEMLVYTLILLPLTLAPYWMQAAGLLYALGASVLGLGFVFCAVRVLRDTTDKSARQMFGYSILYLAALFGLMMVDVWLRPFFAGWLS